MREAFTAPEGRRLIVADYSQIELRAAAAIAGETRMIDAYKAGADLHKLTAATVLGKDQEQVTKSDRQLAKAVNFGLLYGQSAPGLVRYAATSYGVTLTGDQATEIRQAFFRTYSRLRQWHGLSHNQAEAGVTEVRTRTGRRRLIPTTASEWERFTALVNTPVQGGTADGMKHALILIDQRLPKSARIVSTVHDEVVVECHESSADAMPRNHHHRDGRSHGRPLPRGAGRSRGEHLHHLGREMSRDDYSQRQKAKDAEYEREYRAWIDSLPPDERRKLEAQGLDEPDVAHHGNGSAKGDAADSPLMREGDDPAVMPEPEPEPTPRTPATSNPSGTPCAGCWARSSSTTTPASPLSASPWSAASPTPGAPKPKSPNATASPARRYPNAASN